MRKNPAFIILGILFSLNILAWVQVFELGQVRGLEVTFFDVGQGDAIFIKAPSGHQILIDGGPDDTILEKLGREMPFWDRTIDLIILTHPEEDHISGLVEVLKRYKVENILWTGVLQDTAEYQKWQKLIKEENAQIYIARSGQQIKLTKNDIVNFTILYPFESLERQKFKNTNNTSIVAHLVFGETSFLFTGDIYKSIERELLGLAEQLDSDVLKVAHHSSKTSSAKEFIEVVSPEVAVISCGKDNPYGHPHPETLDNLGGIRIFRTDLNGDIKIVSDGIEYRLKLKQRNTPLF